MAAAAAEAGGRRDGQLAGRGGWGRGAGHFPWKDAPERYWPLLVDFVTEAAEPTQP